MPACTKIATHGAVPPPLPRGGVRSCAQREREGGMQPTESSASSSASSERSVSVWEATVPQRTFPPLAGEAEADVCVVGAGIAGMTTAYLLAKAGKRVIVLEKTSVGGGETGQTTAHLSSALDDYFHVLEKVHGEGGARIAFESHQSAIEKVGGIAAEEGIDCDYTRVDGYWFLGPEQTPDLLERERDAARRAG